MSDWDLAKAKFNIEKRGKNLVELASRKCFVNGSALPYVVASSDDETLPKPGKLRGMFSCLFSHCCYTHSHTTITLFIHM
jgi:hypothetical protein